MKSGRSPAVIGAVWIWSRPNRRFEERGAAWISRPMLPSSMLGFRRDRSRRRRKWRAYVLTPPDPNRLRPAAAASRRAAGAVIVADLLPPVAGADAHGALLQPNSHFAWYISTNRSNAFSASSLVSRQPEPPIVRHDFGGRHTIRWRHAAPLAHVRFCFISSRCPRYVKCQLN